MFKYAAVLATASAAVTPDVVEAFNNWTVKYGKKYESDDEWAQRVAIFADNLDRVADLNREHMLAGGAAVHGVTKFMDLSKEEFAAMYLTYQPRPRNEADDVTLPDRPLAADVDWRTKGAVTAVKDQGQCGSCWAFSATEAIESYAFLAGQKLTKLSPQQINSCDKTDGGCNGGNTETAYEYVIKAGGLETAESYPYTSGSGRTGTCRFDRSKVAISIKNYHSVAKGESNLKKALNDGPVSVCLAAEAFQTYHSGILKRCAGQVDHCVQAVGYDDTENYWIVRNSWNTNWGEQGYIRIEQGENLCKIANDVTYPTF